MTHRPTRPRRRSFRRRTAPAASAAAIALSALALPAHADSFTSSVASAGSRILGSLSDSVEGSSNASSGDGRRVAQGVHRVLAVAEVPGHPERLRVTLQPQASPADDVAAPWHLVLPRAALEPRALAAGDAVLARERPYGIEFAHADTRAPFFLALDEGWRRDLESRPVAL